MDEGTAGAKAKLVGSYMEPREVIEKGITAVFDRFQNDARLKSIFFRAYVFEFDPAGTDRPCIGGAYFTVHPEYYDGTFIRDFQAQDGDVLASVVQEAERRGLDVYIYFFPAKTPPSRIPGYESVLEMDAYGNPGPFLCWRNPDYRNHLIGAARDVLTSYPVRGLMWGAERCGPLGWMVLKGPQRMKPACFCQHCCAAAEARGIDSERAREAWRKVSELFSMVLADDKPVEGIFINFWRLLLRYPEVLQWESLWWDGKRSVQKEIYAIAKSIRSGLVMGHHMWHRGRAFSPFNRAALDYEEICESADFVKPAIFSNPASFRFKEQVDGLAASILADLPHGEVASALFRFLGYDRECEYEELPSHSLSPRYVYREVEMAKRVIGDRIPVYAGLCSHTYRGYPGAKDVYPEVVIAELRAASQAGADGVIYDSMGKRPEMSKAIGEALSLEGWV
jgi:hypothetical protein